MRHATVQWVDATPVQGGIQVTCTVCQAGGVVQTPAQANQFALQHGAHQSPSPRHYGAGDAVAGLTKALGIETCTPCEARRRAMNGWLPKLWPRRQ